MISILNLSDVDSTNSYISRNVASLNSNVVVTTDCQTAGRGQRGNSWEAEPYKNLTFSILLRPQNFPANRQFAISQAVAISVVNAVKELCNVDLKIKWPNDIYFKDKKLCGILIEHAVIGTELMHTIAGIGLNVNQQQFFSDAPNPVSLLQITGKVTDRNSLLLKIANEIVNSIDNIINTKNYDAVHQQFMKHLWRNDMLLHKFCDVETGKIFSGYVGEIEPTGHLNVYEPTTLSTDYFDRDNCFRHRYAFKEVEWILD